MNLLYNYAYNNIINFENEKPCHCIEKNVENALNKWKKYKNDFFHNEITEIFKLSIKKNLKYEFNNNLSENTLNNIKIILYVLDVQIENNIFFPCFLMKYYGINYDQSCVIINCLHMMDLCSHEISLKFPYITIKGKQMIDLEKNNYYCVHNWLNNNICTLLEFGRIEENSLNIFLV